MTVTRPIGQSVKLTTGKDQVDEQCLVAPMITTITLQSNKAICLLVAILLNVTQTVVLAGLEYWNYLSHK